MIRTMFLSLLIVSIAASSMHLYAGGAHPAVAPRELTAEQLIKIQNECPICMEDFTTNPYVTRAEGCTCKEIGYHPECLLGALTATKKCPTCNTPASKIVTSVHFQAIKDAQKKQQTPQPAPQQKKYLTVGDFEGIAPSCGLCSEHFTQEDYITKCSCACKQAYHYHCLINDMENKEGRTCPQCTVPVNAIPDGISFALIKPVTPQVTTPIEKQPVPHWMKQPITEPVKITLPLEQVSQEPAVKLIKESSHPLLAEALLAFFYGMVTERIWSADTLNKEQKVASFGGLGLTLLPIHYALHKESPQPLTKRALTWLGGLVTGFGGSLIVKKIHAHNN